MSTLWLWDNIAALGHARLSILWAADSTKGPAARSRITSAPCFGPTEHTGLSFRSWGIPYAIFAIRIPLGILTESFCHGFH